MHGEDASLDRGKPSNEALSDKRRLTALKRSALLDTNREEAFDRLTRLASTVLGVPIALVTLVDKDRQFFKSCIGLPEPWATTRETPLSHSFCQHVVVSSEALIIEDATLDPEHCTNLAIQDFGAVAYAGIPLLTSDGAVLGSFCVMDSEPRTWLASDLAILRDLAAAVMTEIERQEALRETETARKRLALLTDALPAQIAYVDRDERFRFANAAYPARFGRSQHDLLNYAVQDVVPRDTYAQLQPHIQAVLDGKPQQFELSFETPSGERANEIFYVPDEDSANVVQGFYSLVLDITAHKEAAAEIARSQSRLKKILDGLGALAGLLELDGTLVEANLPALAPTGLEPADVVGKKFWDCYWWNYDPGVQEELRQAIARARHGATVRYDVEVRMGEGRLITIDFQLAPLRDDSGQITHLVPSGIDITARQQTEQALRDSERRFRHLANAIPDIVWTAKPDGTIDFTNDRWFEYCGIRPEGPSKDWQESAFHPDDRARRRTAWKKAFGEGAEYEIEARIRRHDGEYRWFLTRAVPVRDADDRITAWFGTSTDIDERKRSEQTQSLLIEELNHRTRNTLTVVQSIAAQTRRHSESLKEFGTAFDGRLQALAATHTLLAEGKWRSSSLQALIEQQLLSYATPSTRIAIAGPAMSVRPKPALALSLVIHELATNAAKYGALSNGAGRVQISWTVTDDDGGERLHLDWRERDGPPVRAPTRKGLGSRLIDFNILHEFEGEIDRHYDKAGLTCAITLPVASSGLALMDEPA